MISNSALSAEKAEDSNFLNSLSITPHNKRQRHENGRYKGVVLQQNGHWGAQIYANHKRYWLGTFKSEKAAAMAYDSAAIKLRSEESHRNFPGTDLTLQEEMFQNRYSTDTILDMIKDGSYETKLADFIRSQSSDALSGSCGDLKMGPSSHGELLCCQLFQKELTPSDVGKLNRLVIPKKHATKYFPEVSLTEGEEGGVDDIQLVFYDRRLKSWKFRYCYWKSSQSFVFTRGWNRFVKDKDLKAKDVVTFYRCEYGEGFEELKWFCMIDVEYSSGQRGNGDPGGKEKIELQLGLGRICGRDLGQQCREEDEKDNDLEEDDTPLAERGVRLFGVHITS